ncbi:MAG: cyanophycinase [Planctomycetota bacterium]
MNQGSRHSNIDEFKFALLNFCRANIVIATVWFTLLISPCLAQTDTTALIRPIAGSRVILGNGEIADYTVQCFLHLCRKEDPNIAVICLDSDPRITQSRLEEIGAGSVQMIRELESDAQALTLQMLNLDGVWIEGKTDAVVRNRLLLALLKNVTLRNGVIAVDSSAVSLLAELDDQDDSKRLASPFSKFDFQFGDRVSNSKQPDSDSNRVICGVPDSSILVVHEGRRIAGYGDQDVRLLVEAANGWPESRGTFECPDVFSAGSYPFYGSDLFTWIRRANERTQKLFPPQNPATPVVESGSLFLHGGSRVEPEIMQQFMQLAGGDDAAIVCIPSAQSFDWSEQPDSYSADVLAELGHSNFEILHTDDPLVANTSEAMATILNNANGVWIDGGRTYRFMDSYQGTRVEKLIAGVLQRGGVVGGSSAGCQVPSDFLVRGNPRTNRDIVNEGYTRGMGLLKGVIIDAHFIQRERQEPFLELIKQYPQMLGIGIDERTAIIVQNSTAKVVGSHAVSFYDLKSQTTDNFKPEILKAGDRYDLKERKKSD